MRVTGSTYPIALPSGPTRTVEPVSEVLPPDWREREPEFGRERGTSGSTGQRQDAAMDVAVAAGRDNRRALLFEVQRLSQSHEALGKAVIADRALTAYARSGALNAANEPVLGQVRV